MSASAAVAFEAVPRARRAADQRLRASARELKVQMGEEGWAALEDGYGGEGAAAAADLSGFV